MLPGQLNLLDWARDRRDHGMALASHAQERKAPRWTDIAYAAIEDIARRQIHVHVDDVLQAGVPRPKHPNAWGAVWMRAIRNDIIQRTNQTRLCTVDPGKNAHRYPVYFSRIHDPRCTP
jgi:hypothetical protein